MADFSREVTRAKASRERSLREQGGKGISGGVFCAQVITPAPPSPAESMEQCRKNPHKYHNALRKVRLRFFFNFRFNHKYNFMCEKVGAVV